MIDGGIPPWGELAGQDDCNKTVNWLQIELQCRSIQNYLGRIR